MAAAPRWAWPRARARRRRERPESAVGPRRRARFQVPPGCGRRAGLAVGTRDHPEFSVPELLQCLRLRLSRRRRFACRVCHPRRPRLVEPEGDGAGKAAGDAAGDARSSGGRHSAPRTRRTPERRRLWLRRAAVARGRGCHRWRETGQRDRAGQRDRHGTPRYSWPSGEICFNSHQSFGSRGTRSQLPADGAPGTADLSAAGVVPPGAWKGQTCVGASDIGNAPSITTGQFGPAR